MEPYTAFDKSSMNCRKMSRFVGGKFLPSLEYCSVIRDTAAVSQKANNDRVFNVEVGVLSLRDKYLLIPKSEVRTRTSSTLEQLAETLGSSTSVYVSEVILPVSLVCFYHLCFHDFLKILF